eukprot:9472357-Pyramimonas_sp.AAC.1
MQAFFILNEGSGNHASTQTGSPRLVSPWFQSRAWSKGIAPVLPCLQTLRRSLTSQRPCRWSNSSTTWCLNKIVNTKFVAVAREPDRFMVAPLLPRPGAKMLSVGGGVCVCTQLTRKVKEYRAQARFKESTMEILLDEAQQMVLLLSSKGNHFEQIMPSLNNI